MPDFKTEHALVLSSRRLGERSFIVSLFTREQGRHLGVLKKKEPPQIGSYVEGRWQARLSDQLGSYYLEQSDSFSVLFLDDKKRLACISTVCALIDSLLPERQRFETLFEQTEDLLSHLEHEDFLARYVRWETHVLDAVGFGLDCTCCAGGGDRDDLCYISPKTGRAVSREKGMPYHDKLLTLPAFLWSNAPALPNDIIQGLKLTGYFLMTHTGIKMLPKTRETLFGLHTGI